MKITILTQYFPPETGAPQNRLFELAIRLQQHGHQVTILTAMPNYPIMKIHEGYKRKWMMKEQVNGLTVIRSWIFVGPGKGVVTRLFTYFSFVISSALVGIFRLNKTDILMVESPPLFLGISAFILAKAKRGKLIFNVSDLWPESAEKLGIVTNRFLIRLSYRLEAFLYRKSALITGQTQGIVADIRHRFPDKSVYWLKNGVDTTLFNPSAGERSWRKNNGYSEQDVLFLYAGVLGHAQALESLLNAASKLKDNDHIKFVFVGTGPEEDKLKQLCSEMHLLNVRFFPNTPKAMMPSIINSSDVAIVHLRPIPLFLGAIPSKIFENLAMEKPLLLGVDGEARQLFVDEGACAIFCTPGDPTDIANKALLLANNPTLRTKLGKNGRQYVISTFERNNIASLFVDQLQQLNDTK